MEAGAFRWRLAEDAVYDQDVEVEVRVERAAEALREGDGCELGVPRGSRALPSELGADRAQEDPEHGARELVVMVQIRPQALGKREHPLAERKVWEHVIGQVGRHFRHTACVARGTRASALAREGENPLLAAVAAANPREAVRRNPAAQVGAEVPFDPRGHCLGKRILLLGPSEKGLQVVLHHRVQRRSGGTARAVKRTG